MLKSLIQPRIEGKDIFIQALGLFIQLLLLHLCLPGLACNPRAGATFEEFTKHSHHPLTLRSLLAALFGAFLVKGLVSLGRSQVRFRLAHVDTHVLKYLLVAPTLRDGVDLFRASD